MKDQLLFMEFLIILLLGGLALKSKAKAGEKIDYDIKNIEISKGKLYLIFQFINPTYTSQKVDSVNLKIIAGNYQIGRIDHFEVINIPARNKTFVKMLVSANIGIDFATFLIKLYKGEIKSLDVIGTYLSMGFTMPVEKTVSI